MQIAGMQAFILRWPEPNDFNHERMTVLLRVDTKAGVSGWGEAIAMWPEACRATVAIIEEGFAPLLAGRDPRDVAALLAGDEGAQLGGTAKAASPHSPSPPSTWRFGTSRRRSRRAALRAARRKGSRGAAGLRQHAREPADDRGQRRGHQGLHRRRIPLGEARARASAEYRAPAATRIMTSSLSARCARRSAPARTSWSTRATACVGTSETAIRTTQRMEEFGDQMDRGAAASLERRRTPGAEGAHRNA